MMRIIGRVFIALLTFVSGLLIFAVLHPSGLTNCVLELPRSHESEIAKTIFRYNIQHFFDDVEAPIYFLSESDDRDAREDVVMSLQREGFPVRRLSQLGMNRDLSFDCAYCSGKQPEFILRVGKIRWLNNDEVLVGGSTRRWYLNADRAYVYHVVLEGNQWVVKHYELL